MKKILAFALMICVVLIPIFSLSVSAEEKTAWKNSYTDVFVPGFLGWGEGNTLNAIMPYWGTTGGDAMKYLRRHGFDCVGADVSPTASNWDRACELYAHITGTVTDYGVEHSSRCGHNRFGKDYTGHALAKEFDAKHKINLIGYSLGGTTAMVFLDLLANGSSAEKKATPKGQLSPLFSGGKSGYVYSMMALATPINGTTAMEVLEVMKSKKSPKGWDWIGAKVGGFLCRPMEDGRDEKDSAAYDMTIDASIARNKKMHLPKNVYYYSLPFLTTADDGNGALAARKATEPIFGVTANYMAKYLGTTPGGVVIDERWFENDGLVNLISAKAPFGAKQVAFNPEKVKPGVWNVMPAYTCDHLMMMGDLLYHKNIRPFCRDLLNTLHSAA